MTYGFIVGVGVHQECALSQFSFAMLMDSLTDKDRLESLWTLYF